MPHVWEAVMPPTWAHVGGMTANATWQSCLVVSTSTSWLLWWYIAANVVHSCFKRNICQLVQEWAAIAARIALWPHQASKQWLSAAINWQALLTCCQVLATCDQSPT
jgi:hypothetical protein